MMCRQPGQLNRRRHLQPQRSGFTLMELITVISLMTTVLMLVGMTFYLLLRSDKTVSQSFVTDRSISRLATQFRDDVHLSEDATIPESSSPPELILSVSDRVHLRYITAKQRVTRFSIENGTVVSREDFQLPECQATFELAKEPSSRSCALIIERPGAVITHGAGSPRPLRPLRVEAFLSRLHPILLTSSKDDVSNVPVSDAKGENQ